MEPSPAQPSPAPHSPLNVLRVPQVVPLAVLLRVEEDDDGRHEVDHLARRQQVQVRTGVAPAVAVDPVEAGLHGGCGGHLAEKDERGKD